MTQSTPQGGERGQANPLKAENNRKDNATTEGKENAEEHPSDTRSQRGEGPPPHKQLQEAGGRDEGRTTKGAWSKNLEKQIPRPLTTRKRRPGLDHGGLNKQEETPPPGLDHPETFEQTPWTGSSRADIAAGAAASRRGITGEMWPDAQDCIIWGGYARGAAAAGTRSSGEK